MGRNRQESTITAARGRVLSTVAESQCVPPILPRKEGNSRGKINEFTFIQLSKCGPQTLLVKISDAGVIILMKIGFVELVYI